MSNTAKLADVARAAGVSQGTVSNVFNRPGLVSDELREKVVRAAADLGYRGPDPRGRLLRAGRVNAIGVVINDALHAFFEDPYQRRFLAGIAKACEARGAGLSLVSALDGEAAAWNVRTALVDGFILSCLVDGSRLVDLAARRGLPFVAVEFLSGQGYDAVGVDDRLGARLAAEHLIGLGHRHIGVLSLEFDMDDVTGLADAEREAKARYGVTRLRLAGYRDAIAAAGLPPPPVYETFNDRDTAAAGVDALLARDPRITAFLAMSDVIAAAAVGHLQARGLHVPTDISVVGYDDTDEAARLTPPLTTIHQPIEDKGRAAVDMVFSAAEADGARTVTLPLDLVIRGTTAPPRADPLA